MFGPDYVCIGVALAMLATLPIVAWWPDSDTEFRQQQRRRAERKAASTINYPGPKEETKKQ